MPEFAPGEAKTAIAPITVSPSGLSCEAEIFLGPDETTKVVTSGRVSFVSTGVSQNVRLPVAMPAAEGTYHVYVDVSVEDLLIGAYQAVEDVIITVPAIPWEFSNEECWLSASGIGVWQMINFSATITNIGSRTVTRTVTQYRRDYWLMWSDETMSWHREWSDIWALASVSVTLAPGASYNYVNLGEVVGGLNLLQDNTPSYNWLEDSEGYKSAVLVVTAHY